MLLGLRASGSARFWRPFMLYTRTARMSVVLVIVALAVGCGLNADAKKHKYLELGDKYVTEKKYQEAIIAYRNAIKVDERFGEARNHLGKVYLAVNDPKDALGELVRAADLLPNDTTAQLDAAKVLILARQYDNARARADVAVKTDPKNVEAHVMRAIAKAGVRDFDAAISDVGHAIELDPNRSATYVELGRIQLMQGKTAEAEATFTQALARDSRSVDANLALASLTWSTNRRADAERFIQQALAIDPGNVIANQTLATLYVASNRAPNAEQPLRKIADVTGAVQAKLDLAEYYMSQRRPDEARKILKDLAAKPEGFAPATTKLAEIEYASGNKDKAHALVDSVLTKQPTNARALVVKGQWLLNERKLDDALARADAAVKAAPEYADAQFLLGSVYALRGEREKALGAYREVLRLNPAAANAERAIAALQLGTNREEALKFAEDAVRAQPNDVAARLLLTRTLLVNGQVERARTELDKAMPNAANRADAHELMGHIQLAQKNASGARQSYERALQLNPNSLDALTGLVQLDANAKQLDQAQRRVDEALGRTPDNPRLLLLAARTYATKGDNGRAESLLKKAIQVDPSFMPAYGILGQLYIRDGKLDEARAEFQQIADKRPDDVPAATMVGMLLEGQGKKDEAKKVYERIYDRNPKAAVAANNLAFMLAEEGTNLDRALNLAQAAKAQMPDDANISDTLGWVYYKKDLASLAIDPLEFSVNKDPSRAAFQYHLGFAYLKAGDKTKGKMWLERALKLQPDSDMSSEARKTLSSS